jgi:hypothetical protein
MVQNKINPFDIIKTTQDIQANVIIHYEAAHTESIDIILPKGSVLFSNTHNYNAIADFSFVPEESAQFASIQNLYLHKTVKTVKVLGYTYTINADDLQNKYELVKSFIYKNLQPTLKSHIYLLAYLFLDNKIEQVSASKWLCFVSELAPLKKCQTNFDSYLITHTEALNIIVHQIEKQIKMRNQ